MRNLGAGIAGRRAAVRYDGGQGKWFFSPGKPHQLLEKFQIGHACFLAA
jgi:hypothetical protein